MATNLTIQFSELIVDVCDQPRESAIGMGDVVGRAGSFNSELQPPIRHIRRGV